MALIYLRILTVETFILLVPEIGVRAYMLKFIVHAKRVTTTPIDRSKQELLCY